MNLKSHTRARHSVESRSAHGRNTSWVISTQRYPRCEYARSRNTLLLCPAKKYRGVGCARAGKADIKGMAGETPSSTARLYSNDRNCYSSRRHVDTPSCSLPLGPLVLLRSINAFVLFRSLVLKLQSSWLKYDCLL